MAGQKKQTKKEFIKYLERYQDNDILLIDTRKESWVKKIGSVTPLDKKSQFSDLEIEAIDYAFKKCQNEKKSFKTLQDKDIIIHAFIGCKLNKIFLKTMGREGADAAILNLYQRYKTTL